MADAVVVPFGHKEIHFQAQTARLVEQFLRTGRFAWEQSHPPIAASYPEACE
jgi:hypothetical protein